MAEPQPRDPMGEVDLAEVRRLIRRLRTSTPYELPGLLQELAAAVPEPTPQMPVVVTGLTPEPGRRRQPLPPRRRIR